MVTDEKLEKTINIILNSTMIMGEVMVAALGGVLSNVAGALTAGAGEVLAETPGQKRKKTAAKTEAKKQPQEVQKEVQAEVEKMADDMMGQITEKWPEVEAKVKKKRELFTDKFCDEGIGIVEKYKFNLPKFYKMLGKEDIISYISMLVRNEPSASKMMDELMAWIEKAPPEIMNIK